MKREVFSMDKGWKFHRGDISVLPDEKIHDKVYAFAKASGIGGPAAYAFDDREWETVNIPHDSLIEKEFDPNEAPNHNYKEREIAWYRMQFRLDPSDVEKNISITFDGIAGVSDVYCNGSWVGGSQSGYSSFTVDITEVASFGSSLNVLAVHCDNTHWEGWWYEGGGIYRHAYLTKKPAVHIQPSGVWAKPVKHESDWQLPVEVELYNCFANSCTYTLTAFLSYGGEEVHQISLDGTIKGYEARTDKLNLKVHDPVLWNLHHPALYHLTVEVQTKQGTDRVTERIGFRTIRIDGQTGFYLNERPVKLKGVCNHLDHGPLGVAIPKEIHRYRLEILQKMGCNAYRCAHNPPPPELLDLCDEMGILVMDENRHFGVSKTHLELLHDLIKRDRNHPCVIMYSIFNEEPLQGTAKGRRLSQKMMAEIKKLDDTRPVLGCFNGGFLEEDGAAPIFDVTGINYFTDSYDAFREKFPNQPIVAAELVSAFATRGVYQTDTKLQVFDNYDSETAPWGQTVRQAWKAVSSREYVMGQFVWTGFDYKGEPTPYSWPSVSSHFGIVDVCGFPKDTYHLYRAYWTDETVLHLLPHWDFPADYGKVKVMAYTNCHEVELFLNGASLGRQIVDEFVQPSWEVTYIPGKIEAVGYKDGVEVLRTQRSTTGTAQTIRMNVDRDWLYRDNRDALVINFSLADKEGYILPNADQEVVLEVTGGVLLGMGNGDPNSHEPDKTHKRKLFNGYCQAILQAGDADTVKVVARVKGLPEQTRDFHVRDRERLPEVEPVNERMMIGWRVAHIPEMNRPDPTIQLDVTDMNTFEPIHFNSLPQQSLKGKLNAYLTYICEQNFLPKDTKLIFPSILGEVEVFLDGSTLAHEQFLEPAPLEVELPFSLEGYHTIKVFVKNVVGESAGILEDVFIR